MESLLTARMVIRPLQPSDLSDFLAYQGSPEVRRYLKGSPMSSESAARFLLRQPELEEGERGRWHGFAVELAENGRMIGDVGVFLQSDTEEGDIGFQFDPTCQGRGYATEAMQAFLGSLFKSLRIERITAGCDPANLASKRLIERLGMQLVTQDEDEMYEISRDAWIASEAGQRR